MTESVFGSALLCSRDTFFELLLCTQAFGIFLPKDIRVLLWRRYLSAFEFVTSNKEKTLRKLAEEKRLNFDLRTPQAVNAGSMKVASIVAKSRREGMIVIVAFHLDSPCVHWLLDVEQKLVAGLPREVQQRQPFSSNMNRKHEFFHTMSFFSEDHDAWVIVAGKEEKQQLSGLDLSGKEVCLQYFDHPYIYFSSLCVGKCVKDNVQIRVLGLQRWGNKSRLRYEFLSDRNIWNY